MLVTMVIILFLFHFRSILIVTLPLPLSILVSFILMNQFGITSNIMSLSGIAIAIGVLVDAGIVMAENAIRHCEAAEKKKGGRLNKAEIAASHARSRATGWPPDFLRDGHHHPRVRAGVCVERAGRKIISSARIHKNICDGRLDSSRHHARAGVVRDIHSRPVPFRRLKPADENPAGDLQSDFGLGIALPQNRSGACDDFCSSPR